MKEAKAKRFPFEGRAKRNLLSMCFAAMCNDTGDDMQAFYLPYFARVFLGADMFVYGVIETVGEATNRCLRIFTGALADTVGRKKPIWVGYLIIAISRTLLFLTTALEHLAALRMTRSVGRALRNPAREAAIADDTTKENRGKAFGLLSAVDTAGAVLGPWIGLVLLSFIAHGALDLSGEFSEQAFRTVFVIAGIPTLLSAFIILLGMKETLKEPQRKARGGLNLARQLRAFFSDRRLLAFSLANVLLALAAVSTQMFLFHVYALSDAEGVTTSLFGSTVGRIFEGGVVYLACTVAGFLSAYPAGMAVDRLGRKRGLLLGMLILLASLILFALVKSAMMAAVPFALYGVFHSIWEAARRAAIGDLAHEDSVAQTMGTFSTIYGLAQMTSPFLFGGMVLVFGARQAFLMCGAMVILAATMLLAAFRESATR